LLGQIAPSPPKGQFHDLIGFSHDQQELTI
jgi:hypothetical protein